MSVGTGSVGMRPAGMRTPGGLKGPVEVSNANTSNPPSAQCTRQNLSQNQRPSHQVNVLSALGLGFMPTPPFPGIRSWGISTTLQPKEGVTKNERSERNNLLYQK